jgi:hypothetical protein
VTLINGGGSNVERLKYESTNTWIKNLKRNLSKLQHVLPLAEYNNFDKQARLIKIQFRKKMKKFDSKKSSQRT